MRYRAEAAEEFRQLNGGLRIESHEADSKLSAVRPPDDCLRDPDRSGIAGKRNLQTDHTPDRYRAGPPDAPSFARDIDDKTGELFVVQLIHHRTINHVARATAYIVEVCPCRLPPG